MVKKVNILGILVIVSFTILLFGSYRNYKILEQKQHEHIKKIEAKKEAEKSINTNTKPQITTSPGMKTIPQEVVKDGIKYNMSVETNTTPEDIEKMKKVSNALIKLHNYKDGKEKAQNLKENFEEGAINMFNPGMTFEELEKSKISMNTTNNKLTIEKRDDAEYTVFYEFNLGKDAMFNKYIINFATGKIRYKEHFYFKVI